jgi:hypothetical protein
VGHVVMAITFGDLIALFFNYFHVFLAGWQKVSAMNQASAK